MANTYERDIRVSSSPIPVYNSSAYPLEDTEVVYIGTPVKLVAGEITPCGATDAVFGFSLENRTGDGETPIAVEVVSESEYEIETNADVTSADIGVSFRFAITSDRYKLDKTGGAMTGTSAVMTITEVIAARFVKVRFIKNQLGLAGPQGPQGA
jgi:hypothetical protein